VHYSGERGREGGRVRERGGGGRDGGREGGRELKRARVDGEEYEVGFLSVVFFWEIFGFENVIASIFGSKRVGRFRGLRLHLISFCSSG
jgi:hypothetical protein